MPAALCSSLGPRQALSYKRVSLHLHSELRLRLRAEAWSEALILTPYRPTRTRLATSIQLIRIQLAASTPTQARASYRPTPSLQGPSRALAVSTLTDFQPAILTPMLSPLLSMTRQAPEKGLPTSTPASWAWIVSLQTRSRRNENAHVAVWVWRHFPFWLKQTTKTIFFKFRFFLSFRLSFPFSVHYFFPNLPFACVHVNSLWKDSVVGDLLVEGQLQIFGELLDRIQVTFNKSYLQARSGDSFFLQQSVHGRKQTW